MTSVVYPGTFDPVTLGHLDILRRAVSVFGSVDVAILADTPRSTFFTSGERLDLMERSLADVGIHEITVHLFDSLLVEFMKENGYRTFVRGLRVNSDFEYEFQMQLMNRRLAPEITGLYLMPSADRMYLSSTLIREVAGYGGDLSSFVTGCVAEALIERTS